MTVSVRRAFAYFVLGLLSAADATAATQVLQISTGFCSPNVYGTGNVTIICKGVDPRAMERLNERLQATALALEQKIAEAEAWALRYRELEASLARATPGSLAADRQAALEALRRGEFAVAIRLLEKQRAAEREQQKEFAETAFQLGNAYYTNYELEKSLAAYQDALRLDPSQAKYWRWSAYLRLRLYQSREAINDLEQAIKIDGTATAWDLTEIARAWQQLGDYRHATERARDAVQWAERHDGATSYPVARALEVLGQAESGAGNFEAAVAAYQRAHKICTDRFGRNDLRCARIRHSLAIADNYAKYYTAAVAILTELEPLYASAYGANSREMAQVLHTMGISMWGFERYDDARAYFERALEIQRRYYRSPHPRIAVMLNALGDTHRMLRNYDIAVSYHLQAIETYAAAEGKDHHHVADAHTSMGRTLKAAGDYPRAIEHFQAALAIYRKTIGADNPRAQYAARQLEAAEKLLAGRNAQ